MIEVSNLQFKYPKSDFSLHIGDLQIKNGSKTAVIGPSGYGKTTLLNLVAGILLPVEGEIQLDGKIINNLSERERRNFRIQEIGFIFQDFRLIPYMNILDNILLPFRINSILKIGSKPVDRAHKLANQMGIGKKLKKYPEKLSHGERQRVAICRALMNIPPVILADEPTGNLDPENKKKIMDILFDYIQENNATLINVTHDHEMLKGFDTIIDFSNFQKY